MEIIMKITEFFSKHKMKFLVFGLIVICSYTAVVVNEKVQNCRAYLADVERIETIKQDAIYTEEASKIVDYYYKIGRPVRFNVVKKTLKAIDYYLPHYFPEGQFDRRDFMAIVMVESAFNQYLVGKAGEKGLFQIMEKSSEWMDIKKNEFDINVNTELGMFVLSKKFKKYGTYKKAIIAYNGVVIRRKKWNQRYWKLFIKAQLNVDIMMGKKEEVQLASTVKVK